MDPGFSIPVKEDLLELDLEHDKITESGMTDVLKDEEQVTETLSDIQLQKELIDRFIINNPRIEPVKEKTDLPLVDISKPFVEEREEFLTETLARIYIKQGYYSKAIDIYEKIKFEISGKKQLLCISNFGSERTYKQIR
jgi:tetratricopeptide (TPR) repeat protein